MNNHKNARLTVFGRQLLVQRIIEQGLRVEEAAHAAGVSTRTAYKWLTRYRQEGPDGLYNRSSQPRNGQNTCNRGCMSTTGIVLMQVWAISPPSAVFNL